MSGGLNTRNGREVLARSFAIGRLGSAGQRGTANVALVMRDGVVRSGLEALLSAIPSVASVQSRSTVDEIAFDHAIRWNIIILSASDENWPVTLQRAHGRCSAKVLLFLPHESMLARSKDVVGIDGVLLQSEIDRGTLARTLTQVLNGDVVLPTAVARHLLSSYAEFPPQEQHRSRSLTDRELQTLRLLADGLSNKQIGKKLGISEHGAKRLVASVLVKLDSPNRTNAVVAAIKEGLLP